MSNEKKLLATYLGLLMLLFLTVWLNTISLGRLATSAAISIAIAKAALILMQFMNLKDKSRTFQITALGVMLWILILFGLTSSDYVTRSTSPSSTSALR